jgi:hypothetical protein
MALSFAMDTSVDQQGQGQGDGDGEDEPEGGEDQGVLHRVPEVVVIDHPLEVLQPRPGALGHGVEEVRAEVGLVELERDGVGGDRDVRERPASRMMTGSVIRISE